MRENLRRYSDCCNSESWTVSFSCKIIQKHSKNLKANKVNKVVFSKFWKGFWTRGSCNASRKPLSEWWCWKLTSNRIQTRCCESPGITEPDSGNYFLHLQVEKMSLQKLNKSSIFPKLYPTERTSRSLKIKILFFKCELFPSSDHDSESESTVRYKLELDPDRKYRTFINWKKS